MSSPAGARLHLQPTDRCPAFDLLLHRPARPTGVITVVGAEVAGVSAAIGGSIVATFKLISLHSRCCRPLRGGESCKAATQAAVAAPQRGSYHLAAPARRPRVSGGFCGDARLACSPGLLAPCVCKKVLASLRDFSRCVYVCACPVRISDAPNSPLHEGMRGVA